jgi:hypothetical protein
MEIILLFMDGDERGVTSASMPHAQETAPSATS